MNQGASARIRPKQNNCVGKGLGGKKTEKETRPDCDGGGNALLDLGGIRRCCNVDAGAEVDHTTMGEGNSE